MSRASKLKFKTEYKNNFNGEQWATIGSNSLSFVLYIIMYLIYKIPEIKGCIEKEETYLLLLICFENLLMVIFSICSYFKEDKGLVFFSLALNNSINFIFSSFYSTQFIEYLSISGIISIGRFIFNLFELFVEPFSDKDWYWAQFAFSVISLIISAMYITYFIE